MLYCPLLIPPMCYNCHDILHNPSRERKIEKTYYITNITPPPSSPLFSQTGTGKTATFAVGILQRLDVEVKQCQALVLAPTRELAQQIVKVIGALGDFMNLKIHACVGGTAVRDDIRTLQDGVHIVVGTPGRVYDMIQRRALRLDSVQLFGTYAPPLSTLSLFRGKIFSTALLGNLQS